MQADRARKPVDRYFQLGREPLRRRRIARQGGVDTVHHRALVEDLRVTVHPSVAVGGDRWLFHRPDETAYIQGQGATPGQLLAVRDWLRRNRDHARACGARYVVVVPP